ncbi:four-carbon acid sugar kinase family protein [Marinactinospora rubrisoli]|uniref:Four-carbon acid sugar kinase family protein n=1 Tax=Marinactinospora rubrisoli TaxID=2715399 RepID=A0ABW2KDZ3_9ACTN
MPAEHTDLLLVADDLTGALDASVPFRTHGMAVTVHLDGGPPPGGPGAGAAVTVLDTDTRHGDAEAADAAVRAALRGTGPATTVVKKVDSTLRGQVRAELAALLAERPGPLVLAPAFPRAGRTTRDGVQHVHGRPLHTTDAWANEPAPPPENIPALLAPLPTERVTLAAVRADPGRLRATLLRDPGRPRVLICDAETQDDLDRLAAAGQGVTLWAGAAGLAAALARRLSAAAPPGDGAGGADPFRHGGGADPFRHGGALPPGRALAVVGSASPVARGQADSLAAAGFATITLDPHDLLAADAAALRAVAAKVAGVAADGDTVVRLDSGRQVGPHLARRLCRRLADAVRTALAGAGLVLVTGGETARAALPAAGVTGLEVLAELEPGTVLSAARAGRRAPDGAAPRHIITKAGGFGDADSLTRAVRLCRDGRTLL